MRTITGLIHVHSNFSRDGHHSVEEIARFGARHRYRFIGMSEHSEDLDGTRMDAYVKECQRASSAECLLIPGIEFSCDDDFHVIGLGLKHYTESTDPFQVSGFIRDHEGVAILAHPIRHAYSVPLELAEAIDGIEVWNAGYDGRYIPNDRSLRLLNDFRRRNGFLAAFGGEDLHRITDHTHVRIHLACEGAQEDVILRALKRGDFRISSRYYRIDGRRAQSRLSLAPITAANRLYLLGKGVRDFLGLWR